MASGAEGRVWTVVVVDDEDDLRALVELTLKFEDSLRVVAVAGNAEQALVCVRETTPDLLVVDHLLGGPVTGLQVAGQVRADLPETRVILFSAADTVIDLREPGAATVDAVVSKMDLVTLPDVARRVLSESEHA